MSRDHKLTCDDGTVYSFDRLTYMHYLQGHGQGAAAAAAFIQEQAVQCFTDGKDEDAMRLRVLAREIRARLIPQLNLNVERYLAEYGPIVWTDEDP